MVTIPQSPRKTGAAFTIVEVILAIVIALGILVVLLYFYQQATNLRSQAIQETERIAAARLLMDRMTGELRAVPAQGSQQQRFVGSSNAIEFVKADVPSLSAWTGGALGRSTFPIMDLTRIHYRLESPGGTNVLGLLRTEEPLVLDGQTPPLENLDDTNLVTNTDGLPIVEEIRFLQFRYWSGTNWLDSWVSAGVPAGVEISLGAEPFTNGTDFAEYPGDIFRRTVYLASSGGGATAAPVASSPAGPENAEDVP